MVDHILAAYDGSSESAEAVEYACEMGTAMGASITVVHAVMPDVYEAAGGDVQENFAEEYRREIQRTIDEAEAEAQGHLSEAAELAEKHGQSVSTELLYGDPVRKIIEYADRNGVDTIVLGHRGQSGNPEPVLGSIAKSIIERSSVPVLVTH